MIEHFDDILTLANKRNSMSTICEVNTITK